jgi:hypothetical protein
VSPFANRSDLLGRRLAAGAVDSASVVFGQLALMGPVSQIIGPLHLGGWIPAWTPWWPYALALDGVAIGSVLIGCWWFAGTPGMLALNLRVIDSRHWGRVSVWRLALRAAPTVAVMYAGIWVGLLLLALGIPDAQPGAAYFALLGKSAAIFGALLLPYLPVAFMSSGRSLWDVVSGTRVVGVARKG